MACGEVVEVAVRYIGICWKKISIPCGIKWCDYTFRYPCGIKWCRKWGIPYPCGAKKCTGTIPYPCGFNWCEISIPYFCLKTRKKKRYCYDFSVIHQNCMVVYEKLYGCCGGNEYSWTDICLGWVESYHTNVRKCFETPLKPNGPCQEGNSIPPGGNIPATPLDEGSVAPHPSNSGLTVSPFFQLLDMKLGKCRQCMMLSLFIFVVSWAVFLTFSRLGLIGSTLSFIGWILVIILSIPFVSHMGRLIFLRIKYWRFKI